MLLPIKDASKYKLVACYITNNNSQTAIFPVCFFNSDTWEFFFCYRLLFRFYFPALSSAILAITFTAFCMEGIGINSNLL